MTAVKGFLRVIEDATACVACEEFGATVIDVYYKLVDKNC